MADLTVTERAADEIERRAELPQGAGDDISRSIWPAHAGGLPHRRAAGRRDAGAWASAGRC